MTQKEQPANSVPDFENREEMAEWFDAHDVGDYIDEFEVVDSEDVEVADNLSEVVTVRLNQQMLIDLRRQAREKGIGASSLARMWLLERLRKEKKEDSNSNQLRAE